VVGRKARDCRVKRRLWLRECDALLTELNLASTWTDILRLSVVFSVRKGRDSYLVRGHLGEVS
jgi:hypothetical protein